MLFRMARLSVRVVDAATKSPIPWTFVQAGALSDSTGLDGTVEFEVPVCQSVTIKARNVAYRPFSRSFHATEERRYEIEIPLEKAIL